MDHTPSVTSTASMPQSERMRIYHKDLLEPLLYPDPGTFNSSLEVLTRADIELLKNLTNSKATIRVLAPYLQIIRRKIIDSVAKSPRRHKEKRANTGVLVDKKVDEQVNSVTVDVSKKVEMIASIHETADVLKLLLKAKTVVTYLVNPVRNEIFRSPRHDGSTTDTPAWRIGDGATMAAHVAFTKVYAISNSTSVDSRFTLGVGVSDSVAKFALCVPIKTPKNHVVGVYEFTRGDSDMQFDKRDVQVVLAVSSWIGVAVLQNNLYSGIVEKQELTNALTQLTSHYHAGIADLSRTLSDITIFARETIGAERCNLYVVNKQSKSSFTLEEYDQGLEHLSMLHKRRTKKVVSKDESMLGQVLNNRAAMTTHTNDSEISVDGVPVRSILCVPILRNKEPIGAIQLTNKRTAAKFDKLDVENLEVFAAYCSLSMTHLKIREQLKKSELNNKVIQEMLFHHIEPCAHDKEMAKLHATALPDPFFTFSWYPSPDDTPSLVEMTIDMFHKVFGDPFMQLNNVPKFVLTVKNCYRPNPYHNFVHAFGVTHAMANIITRHRRVFTGLERKGLMVAALCHDVDHRGYNNNFLQLTQHHLVSLYESSPLENHHFAVTKMIIEQCEMFKYLKAPIFNDFLTEVYDAIIATDLSLYFQCRIEFMEVADEKTFTFVNPVHRRLVKNLIMTACDLSGQTKPLPICRKITEDVYEEFFQQGDVEKNMGYIPLTTMDREKKDMMFENQVQFLSVVVLPCVETISRIFNTLSPMVCESKALIRQWQEMVEVKDDDSWSPEKSLSGN